MIVFRRSLAALFCLASFTAALAASIPVGGRALGPGGRPLPEASVLLLRMLDPATRFRTDLEPATRPQALARAKTDAAGYFDLEAPDAGLYVVRIESTGHVPVEWRLAPLLEPQELPDAELAKDAGLVVRVEGKDEKPLAGALVLRSKARRAGPLRAEGGWNAAEEVTRTAADGSARIAYAGKGDSVLTVSAPGYRVLARPNVRGSSTTFRLAPAPARTIEVKSADGAPVAGALVVTGVQDHPLGITGADGSLRVAVPAPDTLRAEILAPDGRRADGDVGAAQKDPKKKEEPRRFTLPRLVPLSGRLIDGETRKGITGGWVYRTENVWSAVASDATGAYTLYVPEGRGVQITAGATGYMPPDAVSARGEGPDGIGPTIALLPAAAIEGKVLDAAGAPVASATLKLEEKRAGGNRIMIRAGAPPEPSATTSSRGIFRLSGVNPSKAYDLTARAEGLASASTEILDLTARKVVRGVSLVLEEGLRVTGRALDTSGKPIRDVEVTVRSAQKPGRSGVIVLGGPQEKPPVAYTDDEGRFAARGLSAGAYELALRRTGFARKVLPPVEVKPGPDPATVGDVVLDPGERVQGRVIDPQGRPIEGVAVAVEEADQNPMMTMGGPRLGATRTESDGVTGPDGWFTVPDLRRGQALGLALSRTGYLATREAGVTPPTVEPLQVTMYPSSKIKGVVLDDRGAPIPGADITLQRSKTGGGGGAIFKFISRENATSDDGGQFVFDGVEPGTVSLSAKASGWQEAKREALEVPRGDDLTGVEMRLAPGAVIVGRVLTPDGRPAVGAEVGIVSDQPEMVRFSGTPTDGDGRFRLEGVAPGRASVEASHERYVRAVRDVDAKPGVNTVELQLEGGTEVRGVVVDAAGAPVPGAWVHLSQRGSDWGFHDATSGADGSFTLTGVSEGDYSATAGRAGYAAAGDPTAVSVRGEPVGDVRIKLDRGAILRGKITGLDAASFSKVDVRAVLPGMESMTTGSVDAEGNYRLEDLSAGSWRVVASLRSTGEQARGEVAIEPGSTEAQLDLEFGKGLRLTGRIVRGSAPVAEANLFLRGTNVEYVTSSRSERDGNFVVGGLKPGTYKLEVRQWETGLAYEETIDVATSREIVIEIPSARIAGVVVDAGDGEPIPGVTVTLAAPGAADEPSFLGERRVTTDLDGKFRLEDLADGEWRLSASGRGYAAASQSVSVQSGRGPEALRLTLQATEGLTLQVRLPSGRAPREVQAAVLDPEGRALARGTYATGEGGTVRLSTVPSGTWDVLVAAGGAGTAALQAAAPGAAVPVQLPPACAARISVPALATAGVPATATVTTPAGKPYRTMAWFGDPVQEWGLVRGQTVLETIPPGTWTVRVSAADGRNWEREFTTAPGTTSEVVLE